MKETVLVCCLLLLAGVIPLGLSSLPQVSVPSGVILAVPAGTKLHLGDKWIYPQTVSLTLTEWNVSNWVNYTVSGAGTQEVYYGSEPVAVYIDGSHHGEGDGWSYGSSIATVTAATASVCLQYASGTTDVTPNLPQTGTNAQIVHFEVFLDSEHLLGCEIRIYENATGEYVQTLITGETGKVDAQLQTGIYSYEARYRDKLTKASWMHIEEETVSIQFTGPSAVGTGTVERGRVMQYAVLGIVAVVAVFALFTVKKRMMG